MQTAFGQTALPKNTSRDRSYHPTPGSPFPHKIIKFVSNKCKIPPPPRLRRKSRVGSEAETISLLAGTAKRVASSVCSSRYKYDPTLSANLHASPFGSRCSAAETTAAGAGCTRSSSRPAPFATHKSVFGNLERQIQAVWNRHYSIGCFLEFDLTAEACAGRHSTPVWQQTRGNSKCKTWHSHRRAVLSMRNVSLMSRGRRWQARRARLLSRRGRPNHRWCSLQWQRIALEHYE